MKGKLTIMTIMTGVKSPWILGKVDEKTQAEEGQRVSDELGISFVK